MQEDARRAIADQVKSESGLDAASSPAFPSAHSDFSPTSTLLLAVFSASQISSISRFHCHPQIRGWGVKALEFINSGPPALLNNPRCSRRVVYSPFLKHAMEVHYG